MKQTVVLLDKDKYLRVWEHLNEVPDDEVHEVVIRPHASTVRVRQRAYYFVALTAIEGHTGTTVEELHLEYKKRWLVDIYSRNIDDHPGFGEMMESLRELWRLGMAKKAKPFYDYVVESTSIMDAKRLEMVEFLDKIILAAATELNFAVPPAEPDLLKRPKNKEV
jgi:hypothetical protein